MDARGGTLASLILVTVACGLASIGVWHGVSVRAEHDAHAALHQAIRLVALNADLRTQLNSAAAARDLRNCRNGAGPVCYRVAGHIAEARRLIAEITHDLEEMGGAARYDAVRQNLAAHQARLADARGGAAPRIDADEGAASRELQAMQTHVIEAAERAHARFTARGRRHAALSVISLIIGLGLLVYIARQYRERARRLDAEAVAREMAVANARLEKASAAKSVFLANMSHEIRTPLNAILGMATVLQRDNLSQKQRERVGIISSSGQSLLSVLNDILDLSKVEAGKLDLEIVEFDLEQLVRSVESTFAHKAQGKGLAFTVTLDDTASGRFCGDPARIRQVLNNLVSNALKFTESGGVRVTAKALSTPDDATVMLEFAVADTGPGLSPSAIERVFSPFTQADETIARTHGGTGLGLAISKQLCALMGGDIWVQSVESQGATFRFTVAVERALTPASAALADDAFWPAPEKACDKKEPLRVLAAEDNRGNRQVLAALLEPLRSDLTFAENGRQAVTMWSNGAYDVILMDVEMPVMNGVDATPTREIRRVEAATGRARTPIVALTANAMRHQAQQYREAGMDRVVSKPLQLNELIEALVSLADDAPPSAARQEGRA